ncbi:MAG: hypothetical protein JOY90_34025 [Bradyrhizobium sp.]|uniref:hypothetical protein n=1 Tax=Bradyrhizobium sp. TaxID=376 RepID=UPI001D5EC7E6|nr:hypothetical protein [Bradyrhizobium sp.]MBV9565434.1 hypothetical protein [Bradyrhizobium sp.]
MRMMIAIAALALVSMPSASRADPNRGGDAALGALSGAVVFGPIGAVAGAVVGYSAGPSIAHSMGFRHAGSARRAKPARQQARDAAAGDSQRSAGAPKAAYSGPPVQTLE